LKAEEICNDEGGSERGEKMAANKLGWRKGRLDCGSSFWGSQRPRKKENSKSQGKRRRQTTDSSREYGRPEVRHFKRNRKGRSRSRIFQVQDQKEWKYGGRKIAKRVL